MPTSPSLAAALAALIEVAGAADVEESVARAEGESLAAAVAEGAPGAYVDWVAQTGGDRGAEDFAAAASRGRRWRSAPTTTLHDLAGSGHAEAGAYARALSEVCTAAAALGEPSELTVHAAAQAAAAQLSAVPGRSVAGDSVTEAVAGLWHEVMGQLREVGARVGEVTGRPQTGPQGSPLDLGDVPAWAPGAFPGLGPVSADGGRAGRVAADEGAPHDIPGGQPALAARQEAAAPAVTPAAPVEPERTVEELLAELDALVGLAAVKGEVHRQVAVLKVEAKRAAAGLKTPDLTRHLVFTGNPGTGKTTVARLVGGIYRALGLLSKGQLVEVDRSELVAGYLGQTATKTAEVVASAAGGVLFIDEAYSLAGDQYGTEAVDTLVKEMEDRRDDLVVIVAGYPVPMEIFIAQNPGLASRFRTTIEFADYSDDELVAIFRQLAAKADYDVTDQVEDRFRSLLQGQERGATFGNGRYARNVLESAIGHQAWRLKDVDEPSVEQLRELRPEDLSGPTDGEDQP